MPIKLTLLLLLFYSHCIAHRSTCQHNHPTNHHHPTTRLISVEPLKSSSYQYSIQIYPATVTIHTNTNGTFFRGNFSSICLLSREGAKFQYWATQFSFRYPPEHSIVEKTQETLELQITHHIHHDSQLKAPYRAIILSATFMISDYIARQQANQGKSRGNKMEGIDILNRNLQNGSRLDISSLFRIIPQMASIIYRGVHTDNPQNSDVMWMVRKELNLISMQQLKEIKALIFKDHFHEAYSYRSLLQRKSDFYEIKGIIAEQQKGEKKQKQYQQEQKQKEEM